MHIFMGVDRTRKEYDFSNGVYGAVVEPDPGKVRITIRLDEDVIDWFRKQVNAAAVATTRR